MRTQKINVDTLMEAVKRSECLGNSSRQANLLKYLLTEEYEGRGARIKAYSIALDVLGRSDDFDNSSDSIVRVEMHRLRKKLKVFNAASNDLNIIIPKASYRIQIVHKELQQEKHTHSISGHGSVPLYKNLKFIGGAMLLSICAFGAWAMLPNTHNYSSERTTTRLCSNTTSNLQIFPTTVVGAGTFTADMALMVDNYLETGLQQYPLVHLVEPSTDCLQSGAPYYSLESKIFTTAETPYVSIISRHVKSQTIIFSETITLPKTAKTIPEFVSWEFYKIGSKLVQDGGALPQDAKLRSWKNKQGKQDFLCIGLTATFDFLHNKEAYQATIKCMEKSIQNGNSDPNLHGLLALFYIEQVKSSLEKYTDNPLGKARDIIEKAEKTTPTHTTILRARLALETEFNGTGMAESFNTEVIKNTLNGIAQQQAYNSHLLIPTSQSYGFKLGDWETAHRLSQRAIKIDDTNSNSIHYVNFAYEFLFAEPEQAYQTSLKLYVANDTTALLMSLAAANKVGETNQSQKCKENLQKLGLHSIADYSAFIQKRNYEPQITAELTKWLKV